MSELFYMWYITLSGVFSIACILYLISYDRILASIIGILVFFLMMFSLFIISICARIIRRKDTNDDEPRVK